LRDVVEPILFEAAKNVKPIQSARIVAGIYRRGSLLSLGFNQRKSHPLQARFSDRPERIFLHAEIDAIRNFLWRYDASILPKCAIRVVRVKRNRGAFVLGNARPCDGCQSALEFYGIKDIQWSEDSEY
jgi:tRNA(Arg) A34 adenosine deaminase TadA